MVNSFYVRVDKNIQYKLLIDEEIAGLESYTCTYR